MASHGRRDQFTLDLMEKVPQGAGSGTIWDTDGHVVTNAHVIAGASDLQVSSLLPHSPLLRWNFCCWLSAWRGVWAVGCACLWAGSARTEAG